MVEIHTRAVVFYLCFICVHLWLKNFPTLLGAKMR